MLHADFFHQIAKLIRPQLRDEIAPLVDGLRGDVERLGKRPDRAEPFNRGFRFHAGLTYIVQRGLTSTVVARTVSPDRTPPFTEPPVSTPAQGQDPRYRMLYRFAQDMLLNKPEAVADDFEHLDEEEAGRWLALSIDPSDDLIESLYGVNSALLKGFAIVCFHALGQTSLESMVIIRDTLRVALIDQARKQIRTCLGPVLVDARRTRLEHRVAL